jgi:YfiH family protein
MLRFREFESLGLALAGITEAVDGDFARPGGRPAPDALSIAGLASRPVATALQVHGTRTHLVDRGNVASLTAMEGDALITRDTNVAIAVRVADCVPVFLFDPDSRSLGIVHAGRRGTFEGAACSAIRAMCAQFRCEPRSMHALIGPSAGPCCYEVDEATTAEFHDKGLPHHGRLLDLWQSNAMQLVNEGLPVANVRISGHCTICGGQFHSYRADGTRARNLAIGAV